MYHDSHTLSMVMKIEQQLNEKKHEMARMRKECLRPGIKKMNITFRLPKIHSGKKELLARQAETA
jgi:hypothetical protein